MAIQKLQVKVFPTKNVEPIREVETFHVWGTVLLRHSDIALLNTSAVADAREVLLTSISNSEGS